jgi:ADP-ribose pyrophosphatase YjhB (NUDIX family)
MSATEEKTVPARRRSPALWLMQQRWRFMRGLTLGGQVCVLDAAGGVLLVRHGYRPGWHFPGGGVEFGETVRDAALRELEEETGIVAREAPRLHGIFSNHQAFPGDHIAVFVVRAYAQVRAPKLGIEIAEIGFYPLSALPAETTQGTRRRLGEIENSIPPSQAW